MDLKTYSFAIGEVEVMVTVPAGIERDNLDVGLTLYRLPPEKTRAMIDALGGPGRLEEVDGSSTFLKAAEKKGEILSDFEVIFWPEDAEGDGPPPPTRPRKALVAEVFDAQQEADSDAHVDALEADDEDGEPIRGTETFVPINPDPGEGA